MAATPTPGSKSLSQQFLDAYISDPSQSPYSQFFNQASTGTVAGDFGSALQKKGGFKSLEELLEGARSLYSRKEGEEGADVAARRREAANAYRAARQQNYQDYKKPYTEAKQLFREQRAAGFGSPEEEQAARQGLAAVREATFIPYLAGRGVLEGQQALEKQAQRIARMESMKERVSRIGGSIEGGQLKRMNKRLKREQRRLEGMYQVAREASESGSVPTGGRQTLGENLVAEMRNIGSEAASSPWYEKNRGVRTYDPTTRRTTPYSGYKVGTQVGVPGYTPS